MSTKITTVTRDLMIRDYLTNGLDRIKAIRKWKGDTSYQNIKQLAVKHINNDTVGDYLERNDIAPDILKQLVIKNIISDTSAHLITQYKGEAIEHKDIPDYAQRYKNNRLLLEHLFPRVTKIESKVLRINIDIDKLSTMDDKSIEQSVENIE